MNTNFNKYIDRFNRLTRLNDNKIFNDIIVKFININKDLNNNIDLEILEKNIENLFFEENIKYFNEEIIFRSNIFFKNNYNKILNHIFINYNKDIEKFKIKLINKSIKNKPIIDDLIITIMVNVILIYNKTVLEKQEVLNIGISINNFIKVIFNNLLNNYIYLIYDQYRKENINLEYNILKEKIIHEIELNHFYNLIHIVLLSFNDLDMATIEFKKSKLLKSNSIRSIKTFKLKYDYINPNENLYSSFFMNLPMVCKPNPWKFCKNYKGGGYLRNISGLNSFFLSLKKTNNNILIKNSKYLDTINKLQEVSFFINSEVVEYTLNNINVLIKSKIIPDFNYLLLTVEELFNMNVLDYPMKSKDKDLLVFKFHDYFPNYTKAYKFYMNLLLSICFIDFKKLYYPLNIDFRGRMYSQSDYLNPQGYDFEKGLLCFTKGYLLSDKNGLEEWIYAGISLFENQFNTDLYLIDFESNFRNNISKIINNSLRNKSKNFFQSLAFAFEVETFNYNEVVNNDRSIYSNVILSLDCSQSSNQISSALTCNYNVLKYTNIVNKTNMKLDLYQYVSSKLISILSTSILKLNDRELLSEFNSNVKVIESRNFFKKVVMAAVNYGLTPYSFRKEIKSNNPNFSVKLISLIVKETFNFLYDESGLFYRQFSFFKFLKEIIRRREYDISFNLEYLNDSVNGKVNNKLKSLNKYNPIRINLFNNLCLDIFYMEGVEVRFRPYIHGKRYNFTIRHHVNEDSKLITKTKEDNRKILQGFVANFIHSLDAEICIRCLEYFRDRNIPIRSNHDCFYISPKYHNDLRNIFSQVFYDIFNEPKSLIMKLLNDNNIRLTEDELLYIDNFFNSSRVNLKEIFESKWFLN